MRECWVKSAPVRFLSHAKFTFLELLLLRWDAEASGDRDRAGAGDGGRVSRATGSRQTPD